MSEELHVSSCTVITSYKPFWRKFLDLFVPEPVYEIKFENPTTLKFVPLKEGGNVEFKIEKRLNDIILKKD